VRAEFQPVLLLMEVGLMKRALVSLMAISCVAVLSAVAHAQCGVLGAECLVDGDLTLATSGTTTSNSTWALVANMPDGTNVAAQFQSGFANADNPTPGSGVWFKSFEGMQAAADPPANATLSQSTLPVASGGSYQLDFVAGRETNFTAEEFFVTLSSSGTGGSTSIDLLAAPMILGNIGGAASPALGGNPFSLLLSGVSAGDVLTVTGAMVNGVVAVTNPQSAFLDSFSLTRVPEPASAVLGLIAMLGLFGLVRRR
jgi:hypothetical protein